MRRRAMQCSECKISRGDRSFSLLGGGGRFSLDGSRKDGARYRRDETDSGMNVRKRLIRDRSFYYCDSSYYYWWAAMVELESV
jgi:hypothetical protein